MSLLLSERDLAARRTIAGTTGLAGIAVGLRAELEALLQGDLAIPREKALLTREGGRCVCDGWYLPYDPFNARHRCDRCGREYQGERHDRFRLYWHHLWLAERTLHAALLGVLTDDARCTRAAITLLENYASQYLRWPNADNVLGPSRPFFSTYLESIWLLQLAIALDLLETGAASSEVAALGGRVRERLVAPSARLIASYDEGMSNRQVWNNAALLAASQLLGDAAMRARVLHGPSGVHTHVRHALLADGSWYEGENYHFFAHRGLWNAVQMAEQGGEPLPPSLASRFQEGFAAPFRTLLPDLTFPSRRDSQYAISARQPRFAEACELGLAREDDARLVDMLARLYEPGIPRADIGRSRTSADVERNLPATGLSRDDLSWRALLFAREALPPLVRMPPRSDLLPAQGLGILRREGGRVYVALDYGHSGGGHGHPDRLNLLLMDGATRWFDDPGTGSYVDASLHWYRSTLAHSAPLVDGHSQPRAHGRLLAFDDRGDAGWISAEVQLGDVLLRRSVVVMPDYLVDVITWESERSHEISLPLQGADPVSEEGKPLPRRPAVVTGGDAPEDGFVYLRDGHVVDAGDARVVRLHVAGKGPGWLHASRPARWQAARAPGTPADPSPRPLTIVRVAGESGSIASVWSWRDAVTHVQMDDGGIRLTRRNDGTQVHREHPTGWEIERDGQRLHLMSLTEGRATARARSSEPEVERAREDASSPATSVHTLPATAHLGAAHYRRSELSWQEAGRPTADVALGYRDHVLRIDVDVSNVARRFVPIDAENPYDNEPFAINGDGVQLYVMAGSRAGAWLLVPRADSLLVDERAIQGWAGLGSPTARWSVTPSGYRVGIELALPVGVREVALDVLVNDAGRDRERRRGQLVLSGAAAGAEFVYLRGDRHDPSRLIHFSLADV